MINSIKIDRITKIWIKFFGLWMPIYLNIQVIDTFINVINFEILISTNRVASSAINILYSSRNIFLIFELHNKISCKTVLPGFILPFVHLRYTKCISALFRNNKLDDIVCICITFLRNFLKCKMIVVIILTNLYFIKVKLSLFKINPKNAIIFNFIV